MWKCLGKITFRYIQKKEIPNKYLFFVIATGFKPVTG